MVNNYSIISRENIEELFSINLDLFKPNKNIVGILMQLF